MFVTPVSGAQECEYVIETIKDMEKFYKSTDPKLKSTSFANKFPKITRHLSKDMRNLHDLYYIHNLKKNTDLIHKQITNDMETINEMLYRLKN